MLAGATALLCHDSAVAAARASEYGVSPSATYTCEKPNCLEQRGIALQLSERGELAQRAPLGRKCVRDSGDAGCSRPRGGHESSCLFRLISSTAATRGRSCEKRITWARAAIHVLANRTP